MAVMQVKVQPFVLADQSQLVDQLHDGPKPDLDGLLHSCHEARKLGALRFERADIVTAMFVRVSGACRANTYVSNVDARSNVR